MMMMTQAKTGKEAWRRALQLKQAVVACFDSRSAEDPCPLERFGEEDWRRILFWLDISGLALYLLDQVNYLGFQAYLPKPVEEQLQDRWRENKARTSSLMREAAIIATWFDQALIPYALLKGFSLAPDSVPDSTLRWQTDLDFLIPEKSWQLASHYVRRLGYSLHADSGATMEFRAGEVGAPDMAKLYKVHSHRSLELHILSRHDSEQDLLTRATVRPVGRFSFASLSGPDILVQQARHLLKHLCGEHTRMSWVLEFARHVACRRDDSEFWAHVRSYAAEGDGNLAMAVSLWLAADIFGGVPEELCQEWFGEYLPKRVRLWLELYSRELLLSDSIGSKLYAILRRELPITHAGSRSLRKILLPTCLPARITRTASGETLLSALHRYGLEVMHFWSRLRFHVVEGLRFAVESTRWRRAVARVED
jgi:hypothetical protein